MTYALYYENGSGYMGGHIDGDDEKALNIFLELMTEAGVFEIYGDDYGVAVRDLHGARVPYAEAIYKSRVTAAAEGAEILSCSSLPAEGHINLFVEI